MGGIAGIIRRAFRSITPNATRANGGVYYEWLPTGGAITAAAAKALTAHATGNYKFGARAVVLAATANTAEGWAEGILLTNPNGAKQLYAIAVSTGTGAIAAANDLLGVVETYVGTATGTSAAGIYLPFEEPVYIPANVAISLACACQTAAKTCAAHLKISRNK